MCVPVGNVTADTEFSFEYGVKRLKSTSQKQSSGANKGTVCVSRNIMRMLHSSLHHYTDITFVRSQEAIRFE